MQGSSPSEAWAFGKPHRPFTTQRKRRFSAIAAVTAVLLALLAPGALADQVVNTIDTTIDSALEEVTITAGGSTAVSFYIKTEQDIPSGDLNGCNSTGNAPATVNFSIPASVTASATSLTFTGCGTENAQSITFGSGVANTSGYTISVASVTGGKAGSLWATAPASFKLIVNPASTPNTPPTLSLPADMTVEGNTTGGANVTYTATANDAEDGPLTPICSPASGSFFALGGPHAVNCSVTDSGGLTTTGSFNVTVVDTTPSTLQNVPGNISATATSAAGAVVTYTDPTATDIVDPSPSVVCAPVSGSTFAPGTTTVTCTATDGSGNRSSATFDVTVTFAFYGFFRPVDNGVLNSMKGGSTAPIKWQVGDGAGGYIRDLAIVAKTQSGIQACSASAPVDNLEEYATGGTQLRYDLTAEQFIYNWQSPKKPGYCYQVRITLTDGMTYIAQFGLK